MAKKGQKNDISKMDFEQTIKELTGIVSNIEQGQVPKLKSESRRYRQRLRKAVRLNQKICSNRERGGIGRRARFRSLCPIGRGGSTPLARSWLYNKHLITISHL